MSDKKVKLEGVPVFVRCEEHGNTTFVGHLDGELTPQAEPGETVYEDQSSPKSTIRYSRAYVNNWEASFGKKPEAEDLN
jgi:hypothetical protein